MIRKKILPSPTLPHLNPVRSKIQELEAPKTAVKVSNIRYLQLIRSIFMCDVDEKKAAYRTIGLVAVNPKSGTSSIAAGLGVELTTYSGRSTVVANSSALRNLEGLDCDAVLSSCRESRIPNLWRLKQQGTGENLHISSLPSSMGKAMPFSPDQLEASLESMCKSFSYVLVDCPSLAVSADALIIAPMVDGILLIVEAEKTKRRQILQACKMIERSGGKLLGLVLNKRRYPIPKRIFDWLF